MKKQNIILVFAIIMIFSAIYFIFLNSKVDTNKTKKTSQLEKLEESDKENLEYAKEENKDMNVIINNKEYEIILEDNETAKFLMNLLPLELNMRELNGNEKYYYLDEILPTNSKKLDKIKKGDVMLYSNNCLVVFYNTFNTSYSYTKIGHINNLPDLGNENIKIIFNK